MFVRKQTGCGSRILLEIVDSKRTHLIAIIVKANPEEDTLKFDPEYPESTSPEAKDFVQKWIDDRIEKCKYVLK